MLRATPVLRLLHLSVSNWPCMVSDAARGPQMHGSVLWQQISSFVHGASMALCFGGRLMALCSGGRSVALSSVDQ
eukprot:1139434-Pelagomonas_calceolata.AAC.2